MPGWMVWLLLGLVVGVVIAVPAALTLVRVLGLWRPAPTRASMIGEASYARNWTRMENVAAGAAPPEGDAAPVRRRILVVDDDDALRSLLKTTLAADQFEVQEASSAEEAADLARFWRPRTVILDIGLPGADGLAFCTELKRKPIYGSPVVILLTGADTTVDEARDAGAAALLRKPFSPLELVGLLDRVAEGSGEIAGQPREAGGEQLLLYARDLNRLLEIERAQRRLLQQAYRQTATALADALEAKDRRTGLHAVRVQHYALELAAAIDRSLLDDPSLEYGFLLHDIGKIAIPDSILNKPGPLTQTEFRLVQQHPLIGVEILQDVALLQGEGLRVVRSHHERWDGNGYPDRLAEQDIPIGARIFALADALDAMTSDRPYRSARSWEEATDEILIQDGRQFDPRVVSAFAARERGLRRIRTEFVTNVA